jgi:hypothetical protein
VNDPRHTFSTVQAAARLDVPATWLVNRANTEARWGRHFDIRQGDLGPGRRRVWSARDLVVLAMLVDVHRHGPLAAGIVDQLVFDLRQVQWGASVVTCTVPDQDPSVRPVTTMDVFSLTRAGELMVLLLAEAGFECPPSAVRAVPLHPDDRVPVHVDGPAEIRFGDRPRDRRIDLARPEDLPYLAHPIVHPRAVTGA